MGCGNTKQIDAAPPPPNVPRPQAQAVIPVEIGHTNDPVAALNFEYSIPMLLMPFLRFKEQGRIYKSTKTWRDKALSEGLLVEYDEASGKIVIFVSHTWWDREFKDQTNHPDDPYDKGQLLPLRAPRCSSRHPFASRMPVPTCH